MRPVRPPTSHPVPRLLSTVGSTQPSTQPSARVHAQGTTPTIVVEPDVDPCPTGAPDGTPAREVRILMIAVGDQLATAGRSAHTLGIAEHLARTAAEVRLVTGWSRPGTPRPWLSRSARPGAFPARAPAAAPGQGAPAVVSVDHLLARPDGAQPSPVSRAILEANRLVAALNQPGRRPDLVIATLPGLGGAVAAVRLAPRHRVPLIVIAHDLLAASSGRASLGAPIEAHVLLNADGVAITGEHLRAPLTAYGVPDERVRLAPSWTRAHRCPSTPEQARRALRLPADALVVACVDERGEQHLPPVLQAAALLHAQGRDVRVLVIGERGTGTRPRRLRRGDVRWLGRLDPQGTAAALCAADLVVISEPAAGQGAADISDVPGLLADHYAAARPLIAAADRHGSLARAVARGAGAGIVVPAGDAVELAAAVARLGDHPDLRAVMGERAAQCARQAPGHREAMEAMEALVARATSTW
ncbi:MAG: glycosyltransferase [Kineosporiaceae bacterium]|nr:glycosyltransferase [Kineosporiaceae bacterium]